MGIAILKVAPDLLATVTTCLPAAVKIVGSAPGDGVVALLVEGEAIPLSAREVRAIVRDNGLERSIWLEVTKP